VEDVAMKCLSLWQPWATLLATGKKRVETRSWELRYRGPLLIHAAKKWEPELAEVAVGLFFRGNLESLGIVFDADERAIKAGWGLPFGAIVGRVDVTDCFRTEDVRDGLSEATVATGPGYRLLDINISERAFGDYSPGRFAFLCANAVKFDVPIPYRGAQGLFDVPDQVLGKPPTPAQPDLFSGIV
jgi:activating signal cointegrator 1